MMNDQDESRSPPCLEHYLRLFKTAFYSVIHTLYLKAKIHLKPNPNNKGRLMNDILLKRKAEKSNKNLWTGSGLETEDLSNCKREFYH